MKILIGHERGTKKPVYLPLRALERHLHLPGYTGAGKTTAIITLLTSLCFLPVKWCVIVIDRLGGFSQDLLRFFASSFAPQHARERLLYIEGAREDRVVPINPLLYSTPGEAYYRTARACEIILRGWASQNLQEMPRLFRNLFNTFCGVSQLGLTIGDGEHLLNPHSDWHAPMLAALPERLQAEWRLVLEARGGQPEMLLDSCRNRLKPFFESPGLRAMFSSARNMYDVARWMREGRFVILNLAPFTSLPETMADTIAGLTVNEVFSVARSLRPEERVPTLLVLDEFQRFISADLELALAESRQLRTHLILSHQSVSQLQRGTVDLTSLIFQAQTRLALHVEAADADLLAEELASLTFDPRKVKDEIWHRCQRVSGHRVVELETRSRAEQFANQWSRTYGSNWSAKEDRSTSRDPEDWRRSSGAAHGGNEAQSAGGSRGTSETHGVHQSLVPIYDEYLQLASRSYLAFDDQRREWGRRLRETNAGEGVLRIAQDPRLYDLIVRRTAPGHLALDWATVQKRLTAVADAYEELLERNFAQDFFLSPAEIERETERRLARVLRPRIELRTNAPVVMSGATASGMVPVGANPLD